MPRKSRGRIVRTRALIETMEPRTLMSAALFGAVHVPGFADAAQPDPGGFFPLDIRTAYGVNSIKFGTIVGDGTGQTIAIIDAYDTPTIANDLKAFDLQFSIPDPPSFKRVAQDGTTHYPPVDPASQDPGGNDWESETALDVEWSHTIAPKASILLVEATDESYKNLFDAAPNFARKQPGVTVVSMSFGDDETNYTGSDATYTTPAGHVGVTFIASAGDSGAYSAAGGTHKVVSYPASSPNVLAIGGTTLNLTTTGSYQSETTWGYPDPDFGDSFDGTGGGVSVVEHQPAYQTGVVTQSKTFRTVPDVSMDADPNSGVNVYDTFNGTVNRPWSVIGGTSLSAPMWAGLIAIANQGRVVNHATPMNGQTQTLPWIYSLPATDFHDIIAGNNGGYHAAAGYDLTTGRGTPIANLVIPALAGKGLAPQPPVIGSVTASPSPVPQGTALVLTANEVGAVNGTIKSVAFYRETNKIAGLQVGTGGDTLVSTDTVFADGSTATVPTTGLALGAYTFYARATTVGGLLSPIGTAAPSVAVTVAKTGTISGPVIASLTSSLNPVTSSTNPFNLIANGVTDNLGTIVKVDFYLEFDNTPGLQTDPNTGDFLDWTATSGAHGWTDPIDPSTEFDPESGVYTFYAVATDNKGHLSAPVSVQVTYTAGDTPTPTIAKLSASSLTVAHGTKVTLTASGFNDIDGDPIYVVFYRESNNTAGLQATNGGDVIVGSNLTGSDPSSVQITAPTAPGTYTYYAQMTDDDGVATINGTKAVKLVLTVT